LISAFLDANVLFSAAYAEASPLLRLWKLRGVCLCTSEYALDEARRNLRNDAQKKRLVELEKKLELLPEADKRLVPPSVMLREKDIPILSAAIAGKANYLVTGDNRDFGNLFGKAIAGVIVLRPREFLQLSSSDGSTC
jgi:predicted nucleic acid-binding protein